MAEERNGAARAKGEARHVPMRMCAVCRRRLPKHELRRFVARGPIGDGTGPQPDPSQTMPGRGVYVCPEAACMEKFRRRDGRRKEKGDRA